MRSKPHHSVLMLFGIVLLLGGCIEALAPGSTRSPDKSHPAKVTLTVFAAASLTDAFMEIEAAFEKQHPQVEVMLNLAGSQQLANQILAGAPADIFASANTDWMRVLIEAGSVSPETVDTFAYNQLVVITPDDNPAGVQSLEDLGRSTMKIVLASEEVPVGRYTRLMLENAAKQLVGTSSLLQDVFKRTVSFEQNVRAVRTKVMLGEADAGIVYKSDVSEPQHVGVSVIEIPQTINPTAAYPIATLADDNSNSAIARAFMDFVLAPEGQKILARYGFVSV